MELCTARAISNLPQLHKPAISSGSNQLRWKPSLPLRPSSISLLKLGLQSRKYSSSTSASSDEISSVTNEYIKDETDGVITFEDRQPSKEKEYGQSMIKDSSQDEPVRTIIVEDDSQSEEKEYSESDQDEAPSEDSTLDVQKRITEYLDQLNIKFDSEDSYSLLLFGTTAAAALWFATAVVGAIDSIPVLPKLLEIVGLGYTVWFSSRYLIFKRNRDELAAKIDDLKQQVLGSKDD